MHVGRVPGWAVRPPVRWRHIMSCGASGVTSSSLRGGRFFGQGAGWRFRTFVAGLSCPPNRLPQAACDIDFTAPAVAIAPVQLTPMAPAVIVLTKKVSGIQTGTPSCNVRVFRQDTTQVPGTVAYDPATMTITFTPSATYCAGVGAQNVIITLGSNPITEPQCPAILDSCGNRLPLTNLSVPVTGC